MLPYLILFLVGAAQCEGLGVASSVQLADASLRGESTVGGSLPQNGRVVVLLRGASFRSEGPRSMADKFKTMFRLRRDNCNPAVYKEQMAATNSVVENVIKPLEAAGNQVDVIITDKVCSLTKDIEAAYGQRVIVSKQEETKGQPESLLLAMDTLHDAMSKYEKDGQRDVPDRYNVVFMLRHDVVFDKPVTQWPDADFSKFLFPYNCPYKVGIKGHKGKFRAVHDIFQIMPGSYFETFRWAVHKKKCAHGADGHTCAQEMKWALKNESKVGVTMRVGDETGLSHMDFFRIYGKPRPWC